MSFLAELFFEFFLDLFLSIGTDLAFGGAKALDRDRMFKGPAMLWLLFWGFLFGALSALLISGPILRPGPVPGLSLVVLPILLGAAMQVWGVMGSRKRRTSHLASWSGGASMGLGLAAGRFVGLRFIAEVWPF